ncbi:hypothetical protein ACTMTJ_20600 [Phytohabitans sp. LJ34]|uniref:hypothetical protein n=1 Tax=Phytohabitans sp. LJ34 TaxID=3452217 RepID=UPI003F8AACDD
MYRAFTRPASVKHAFFVKPAADDVTNSIAPISSDCEGPAMPSGTTATEDDRKLRRRPRRNWLRTAISLGLTVVVAAAGMLVLPATKAMAVAGLQYIDVISEANSETNRSLKVLCPGDTRGLGGALTILDSKPAKLQGIEPQSDGVVFYASEVPGGTAEAWSFAARATCAPASSLPGLEYRPNPTTCESVRGEPDKCIATASCRAGKQVIGMGGHLSGFQTSLAPEIFLTATDADNPGFVIANSETVGSFNGSYQLTATPVCVTSVPGRQIVKTGPSIIQEQPSFVTKTATCPGTTLPHAAGFSMEFVVDEDLNYVFIYQTTMQAPRDATVTAVQNVNGVEWALDASVICA